MPEKMQATMTSKGQITLPAALRKHWGLKAGDQLVFDPPGKTEGRFEPRRKRSIFERLDELKLPSLGRPLTQEDIDEAIGEAIMEKHGHLVAKKPR
jgi:AbrB family looped-hinge helix DNA binding protein